LAGAFFLGVFWLEPFLSFLESYCSTSRFQGADMSRRSYRDPYGIWRRSLRIPLRCVKPKMLAQRTG
jgi:hypothetical protein